MAHLYVDPRNPLATLEHSGWAVDSAMNMDSFAWGFPLWLLDPTGTPIDPSNFESADVIDAPPPVAALPTMGQGDNLTDGGQPVPVGEPVIPFEELCWVDLGTGRVKCWTEGSIWAPGEIWGPPGEWLPESEAHPDIINPEFLPDATVFEEPTGEEPMPLHENIGWTDSLFELGANLLASQFGPQTVPAPPPIVIDQGQPMVAQGNCPTRKTRTLTIDCATGQEVKRTRRRRRRLLTSGDLGDLAQLQALVGKGSNAMSVAVSKAIR